MKFIYHNEYHGIEFSYFEKNGYELVEIPQNTLTKYLMVMYYS